MAGVSSAASEPSGTARPRGMRGSAKSMVISMVVVGAACLVWLAFLPRISSVPQATVDDHGIARETAARKHWDVAIAQDGRAWRPVNVRMLSLEDQRPTWQAGYAGPDDAYAAAQQTAGGDARWTRQQTGTDNRAGESTIGGVAWQRYEDVGHDQKSLVRSAPLGGLSTVVTGKGSWGQLEQFAGTLVPFSKTRS